MYTGGGTTSIAPGTLQDALTGGLEVARNSNRGGSSSGLTPAMIEALKRRGYNQKQIAEMYGISRQRVSQIKYKWANYYKSPRERAKEIFPFDVPRDPDRKSVV